MLRTLQVAKLWAASKNHFGCRVRAGRNLLTAARGKELGKEVAQSSDSCLCDFVTRLLAQGLTVVCQLFFWFLVRGFVFCHRIGANVVIVFFIRNTKCAFDRFVIWI